VARNRSEKLTPDQLAMVDFALFVEFCETGVGRKNERYTRYWSLSPDARLELDRAPGSGMYTQMMAYIFKTYGRHGTQPK